MAVYLNVREDNRVRAIIHVEENATESMVKYEGEMPKRKEDYDPEKESAILMYSEEDGLYYEYQERENGGE